MAYPGSPVDVNALRQWAYSQGWHEVQFNPESKVIGFKRDNERVNVYYTTGTVGTCVDHPRQGKTQLFRREQSYEGMQRIFANPRIHTGESQRRLDIFYCRRLLHR
jgi:hypothetical protein